MRRLIVIAATMVAVMASALSASAATRHPVPRMAPRTESATPARHTPVQIAADIAAAKQGAAYAVLTRIVAQHTAHLAHTARTAHARHTHLLHLRQLAVWSARAEAKAYAAQLAAAAPAAAPASAAPRTPRSSVSSSRSAPSLASARYTGSSSMQQCIIRVESGGNSQVMNSSSHYGLYQFSASTWSGSGGNPADFGHASVAEQNQVFANAVAARGYSDWTPYDGC